VKRFPTCLLFGLVWTLPAFAAQADEPVQAAPAKAEKAQPERVHLGSASVTVVDEHEAVDEVISRIRNGKVESPAVDKSKTTEIRDQGSRTVTTTDTRQGKGRSSLRTQRDRASARAEDDRIKDERRERAATTRTRLEHKQRR
jgi:uncharacterized membrane protein